MSDTKIIKFKTELKDDSTATTLENIRKKAEKAAKAIDGVSNRTAKRRNIHKKADPFGVNKYIKNPASRAADPLGTRFLGDPSHVEAYHRRMKAKYARSKLLVKKAGLYGAPTEMNALLGQNFNAGALATGAKGGRVVSPMQAFSKFASRADAATGANKLSPKMPTPYGLKDPFERLDNYERAYNKHLTTRKKMTKQAFDAFGMFEKQSTILTKEESKKRKQLVKEEKDRQTKYAKDAAKKQADIEKSIKNNFAAGFSMHILQIYAMPFVYALNRVMSDTLQTFGEFDKKFTDYTVKSEEFAGRLSKSQFYDIAAGQTYSLIESASAAERFAASGIDVANSQEALTDTLKVATISGLDYTSAANGIIRTMQAMHMEIGETATITDAMVNSANASTAELKDLVGWFEYSAAGAYQAGLNVKELSAMLGILSSTGLPNTGTAARQLFLQFSKQSVRDKFMERFSWIDEDSFADADALIKKLRQYVQASEDQAKTSREVTQLLGGKVTAQQALNNLLVAEESLWNQVNNAVAKTGTTQDLYNKVTDNTGHALQRLANSWELFKAQFGEIFHPIVNILEKIVTGAVKIMNAIPTIVKQLGGLFMLLATGAVTAGFAITGLVGALAIMQGATKMLATNKLTLTLSTETYIVALKELQAELLKATGLQMRYDSIMGKSVVTTNGAAMAGETATRSFSGLTRVMKLLGGGMIGYMLTSSAMEKQMYSEAHLVSLLTSAWIGYNAAKMAAFAGPAGAVAIGVGAGLGYETLMYSKIKEAERQRDSDRFNQQFGLTGSTTNYNINVANANLQQDGVPIDEFAWEMSQ